MISQQIFGGKYPSNNCCVIDAQLGHILHLDMALHCSSRYSFIL